MPLRYPSPAALVRVAMLAATVACAVAASVSAGAATAASSSSVVGATVLSSTNLDASSCPRFSPGVTDFGAVTAGSSVITPAPCTVVFGSSNDTAALRVAQSDSSGKAMFLPTLGGVDPTYGGAGAMIQSIGGATDFNNGAVMLDDGRFAQFGRCNPLSGFCVLVANPNGTPSVGFSGDGRHVEPIGTTTAEVQTAEQLDSGDIVLVGSCTGPGGTTCLMRLRLDGSLEPSFGTAGKLSLALGSVSAWFNTSVMLANGDLLIAGSCNNGTGSDFCAYRLQPDGTPRASFGTNGLVTVAMHATLGDGVEFTAVMPDGDIILGGICPDAVQEPICAYRMNDDGTADGTFGVGGKVFVTIGTTGAWTWGADEEAHALDDGDVVIPTNCYTGTISAFCAVRINPDGTLDAGFGTGGRVMVPAIVPSGSHTLSSSALLADDSIVMTGQCYDPNSMFCATRINSDGSIHTAFGTNGKLNRTLGTNGDYPASTLVTTDGAVIMTGNCYIPGGDFCSMRLEPGATIDQYASGPTDWDSGAATNMFGACLDTVAGGAARVWNAGAGACTATDGGQWNAITTSPATVARTTVAGSAAAEARLRFGLRTTSTQRAGRYVAPITFDVVAPG